MRYAYPAIFIPVEDGGYSVVVPDLPGCRTCGKNLADAIFMAEDAISMWLWDAENNAEEIPKPGENHVAEMPQFLSYVMADTDEFRRRHDNHAVKKNAVYSKLAERCRAGTECEFLSGVARCSERDCWCRVKMPRAKDA